MRLVTEAIKGKSVPEALAILAVLPKRAVRPLTKLLKSAAANAKGERRLDEKELYISRLLVDKGSVFKRFRPRARGRAEPIRRRTSRVTVILGEKNSKK